VISSGNKIRKVLAMTRQETGNGEQSGWSGVFGGTTVWIRRRDFRQTTFSPSQPLAAVHLPSAEVAA